MEKGFTLAEVLVTLMIIGIVAAMSIPSLIAQHEKQVLTNQLKKFYTEFNHALQQLASNYDCPSDFKCTGIFDIDSGNRRSSIDVIKLLTPYLNIDKICANAGDGGNVAVGALGCFGYNLSNRPYRLLNGAVATTATFGELNPGNFYWSTMSDGTFFGLYQRDWSTGTSASHCNGGGCASLYVDVNGVKAPNQLGRDVFWFTINDKANISPWIGTDCNVSDMSHSGQHCSGKIIQDNWQMNY